ncbi:MAG: 23S rRNA (uracil(1939)-C(5))-methyltransferase RlmD [Clostridiales bacterium]|nr:23S rRNA (uracil(1939)-C(5))-methyltransferase RlmD [Clostridiales bacterium]
MKDRAGKAEEMHKCPVAKKCGGCRYAGVPYAEQLAKKQKYTEQLLKGFGKVNRMIGMEQPEYYRNKVHAVYDFQKGRGIVSGIYQENSHHVIAVDSCLLENQKADAIIVSIRELAKSFKIKTYNEDTGYGLLRHVLIRVGYATGQIMVVLVLGSPILPSKKNFVNALCKLHPEITTIVLNVNHKKTSMVLGDKEQVLYGKGYIEDVLCGCTFRISPKSFYQVNAVQTEKLYRKAIEYASLTGRETVIDAYCGIGTIGLAAASKTKKVIGVELNQDAVRDAVANAKRNQIKNIDFYQNDAGRFMVQLAQSETCVDVVFMDPPRSGSTEEFMNALLRLQPSKIVYISCNPETLARDLAYLTGAGKGSRPNSGRKGGSGYRVMEITPVDMFPYTECVETCVLLCHQKAKKYVTIDYTPDGSYMDEVNRHASYREVQEYIEGKYGLKVHSAYIAQVKRECGIEMGANYNLSKSEDYEPKQVTPEKREAIIDALRHFRMIE